MGHKAKILFLALSFIVITVLSVSFFGQETQPVQGGSLVLETDGRINVLIVGEDDGLVAPGQTSRGRSDTLMLASLDSKSGEISLLSIPRDTRVNIPGRKYKERINHAYAYGGIDLTMRTVREFLGIPIRYYVHVNTSGFRKLVDEIGGVPLEVEKNMKYKDRAGNLYIDLEEGYQTLNGEQAEGYVRYRWSDSDYERTKRQQHFLKAALKQVLRPKNLIKINHIFKIANETIQTNIPLSLGLKYLPVLKSLDGEKVINHTLDGEDAWINGMYFYEPDLDGLAELMDTYFFGELDREANQNTTVSIYGGTGSQDCAEQVAELLKKQGFRVQNIRSDLAEEQLISQVISTTVDSEGALAIARILSVQEVLLDEQSEATTDVVVIIGKDMLP